MVVVYTLVVACTAVDHERCRHIYGGVLGEGVKHVGLTGLLNRSHAATGFPRSLFRFFLVDSVEIGGSYISYHPDRNFEERLYVNLNTNRSLFFCP